MKIHYYIVFVIAIIAHQCAFSQQLPLATEAAKLCQQKQFDLAKTKIAEATLSPEESKSAYTWYVKGFIHKECYKEFESNDRYSTNREHAVEAFSKSLEIDRKGEQAGMAKIGLKYLASTYYNDALMKTREFVLADQEEPQKFFNSFRRLMRMVEATANLTSYEVEFQKNMGQRYFILWQSDVDSETLPDKSAMCYKEAIRMDSTNCDLYYNLAVVYYNKAVFKYRKINADTDIFEVITIQMDGVDLFKNKALPAMSRARLLCPERGDVIKGLMYIHKALEHENDVEYFKAEIERLLKEGKLDEGPPKQ